MAFDAGSGGSAADQPWDASWCWSAASLARPWNVFAYFRKVVELPVRATAAIVRVSADARYTLFVNGRRIHQGPARCHPRMQSYDTLDLADYLTAGTNAICAIVHQFGVPTGQSAYRDASGFLLDGVVETAGTRVALHTPAGWLCRDAAGWRKHVARVSARLGFQEHFDADADPPDWFLPEYEATAEAGWAPAVVVAPVGGHPWVSMWRRGAPLLAGEVKTFAAIVGQFTGENSRGYKVAEDVFQLSAQEARKKAKTPIENSEAMIRDDDQAATLAGPIDGNFHMAVLDLGHVRNAHVILDLMEAAGDEIIDVLYLNDVDKAGGPLPVTGDAPADRYRCRPGAQRWEAFSAKGFRYAAFVFRNVEKPLKIRYLGVRVVHAALEQVGTFETSDPRLNQIYAAGVETVRGCLQDALIDGPDLGQIQEWGEARKTARNAAYVFGDLSLLERGIREMARSQTDDGSLHGHPPADDPRGRNVDAMFAWVGTLWDHYFQTESVALARECVPVLDRLLRFFAKYEAAEGLLGEFVGFDQPGRILHPPGSRNMSYLRVLRWSAAIYEALDLEAERARMAAKADALAKVLEQRFWDEKGKIWRDSVEPADASVLTNALAILLRLRPEGEAALARDVVLRAMNTRRGKISMASPTESGDVLEALSQAGLHDQAVELIGSKWGAMLDRGQTTFGGAWDDQSAGACRGAAASPVRYLVGQILGVTPVEAGWRHVRIAPQVGTLDFARGTVPTPLGVIRVEWEKAGEDQMAVRIELPDPQTATFVSPVGETRELESGATEFHT